MPVFRTSKRVAVPVDVAFAVAADVASYKDFLPLLQRSTIRGPKRPTSSGETFDAELAVSYPKLGLSESFISKVETDASKRTVQARSSDAPFRNIETIWQITQSGDGADVSIHIDYAFRNPFIQLAAGGLMDMAIGKVMSAFELRAKDVLAQQKPLQHT
jgi:coenzyme Q-binding protein COQ10